MTDPRVTVVVVPRERFSYSGRSLEGIYEHTNVPFDLVYVDGGSPRRIRRYLATQARERRFRLLRTDHYLTPNRARNLGLAEVDTEYVVFVDNDVAVTPGWLERLLECADETGAAVVGPLTCEGEPKHERVHLAGGEVTILEEGDGTEARRTVKEQQYFAEQRVADIRHHLRRRECRLAEFHCILVRRSIFEKTGPFDEDMLNTREHLDFCLEVSRAGGAIYFEPAAVVTFLPAPPFKLTDIPYYMLRWSDTWEMESLRHFRDKWGLAEDEFFQRSYENLGWRRNQRIVGPVSRRLTLGMGSRRLESLLSRPERRVNRYLVSRHARTQAKLSP